MLVALSYYMLGYILVTDRAPWPAFAGVVSMIVLAQFIAKLDMSLSQGRQLAINVFLIAGPVFACIACYKWGQGKLGKVVSYTLAPAAFFSHGIMLLILTWSCQLQETRGAGKLPTAFKQILYLDVFGWISRKSADAEEDEISVPLMAPASTATVASGEVLAPTRAPNICANSPDLPRETCEVGYYAMDFLEPVAEGDEAEDEEVPTPGVRKRCGDPGLQAVVYDSNTGQNVPMR